MSGEDRFFEKDGDLTLRYRIAGEGPPVTLNHGVGSDLESWDEVVPVLSPHFTVLRYDMRGHGGSTKVRAPFKIDAFVDDYRALLSQAISTPARFDCEGDDWGFVEALLAR